MTNTTQTADKDAYIYCTMRTVKQLTYDAMRARVVPNLVSSPGLGKSSAVHQIAEKMELFVIDLRMASLDPTDMNGFPGMYERTIQLADGRTDKQKLAGYFPMDTFPLEGMKPPINQKTGKPYKGWILFLDEFNAAPLAVQAAAYKLVLDKMVGQYHLHKKCYIICAGNLTTDRAIVNKLSTAMQSRVSHLVIQVCHDSWHHWANANDVDHRVKSFLKYRPNLLHSFDPNHSDLTFPCPRTWDHLSRIISFWPEVTADKLPLIAGTVGKGAAREFWPFCSVYKDLPSLQEILANPMGVSYGDAPSVAYALSGIVGNALDIDNVKPAVQFLRRLGPDFQVIALRQAVRRDPELLEHPIIDDWVEKNADEFIAPRIAA